MKPGDNPNWFANSPLDRAYDRRGCAEFIKEQLGAPDTVLIPLWRGDPLVADNQAAFLSAAARGEFPEDAPSCH